MVFYVKCDDHIDVWRVLHGLRDIPAWLREAANPTGFLIGAAELHEDEVGTMRSREVTHSELTPKRLELLWKAIADRQASGTARPTDEVFDRLENKYQAAQTVQSISQR